MYLIIQLRTSEYTRCKCRGGFVFFYMEIYLVHSAHGIEDINTLDVDKYYYLFNSSTVRTQ